MKEAPQPQAPISSLTALNADAGAQSFELLRDLKGQLSGGGEDQGVKPLRGSQQRLEDRQSEGPRLS